MYYMSRWQIDTTQFVLLSYNCILTVDTINTFACLFGIWCISDVTYFVIFDQLISSFDTDLAYGISILEHNYSTSRRLFTNITIRSSSSAHLIFQKCVSLNVRLRHPMAHSNFEISHNVWNAHISVAASPKWSATIERQCGDINYAMLGITTGSQFAALNFTSCKSATTHLMHRISTAKVGAYIAHRR